MPLVSIVIRSRNEAAIIERTLAAIREQEMKDYEILAVDSSSTDGTYEILQKANIDQLWQIKSEDYVPGRVLNDAVKRCKGRFIVFNNADCVPVNSQWLGNLVKPLIAHPDTIAAYGRQVPRADAYLIVSKDREEAHGTSTAPIALQKKRPKQLFSLSTSAFRHEIIERYSFTSDMMYSEDVEWYSRMRRLGYVIEYAPDAIVEHSHNYDLEHLKKRYYNTGFAQGRIHDKPLDFFWDFLVPFLEDTINDSIYLIKKGQFSKIPHGVTYRYIQKYAFYKGIRDYFSRKADS